MRVWKISLGRGFAIKKSVVWNRYRKLVGSYIWFAIHPYVMFKKYVKSQIKLNEKINIFACKFQIYL